MSKEEIINSPETQALIERIKDDNIRRADPKCLGCGGIGKPDWQFKPLYCDDCQDKPTVDEYGRPMPLHNTDYVTVTKYLYRRGKHREIENIVNPDVI